MRTHFLGTLVMALGLLTAAPVRSGQVTIHNDDCHAGFQNWVKVHVYDKAHTSQCTNTWVEVNMGSSYRKQLIADSGPSTYEHCLYSHEADGVVHEDRNVEGNEDSHVTCRKDGRVCRCIKD